MEYFRKRLGKLGVCVAGLLCIALLVTLFPAKEVLAYSEGTVTASSANIREKADAGSTALASVLQGNKLTVIESVTGADGKVWYKVFIDANTHGYIRSDLLSTSGGTIPTVTPKPENNDTCSLNTNVTINMEGVEAVQPVSASVTNDRVRVRADSSTDSSIVTTVREDAVLTVHGTKAGNNNEVWYQVSFLVDGTEVNGYIRSDFVTLNGTLVPETAVVPDVPDIPQATIEPEPTAPPVVETKDFDTQYVDGVWYLIDHSGDTDINYPIQALIASAEKNADLLEDAQEKISRQNGIIIFLSILVVIAVLGITILIFKIKDMMEDDGFESKAVFLGKGDNQTERRPARPTGNASGQGSRTASPRPTGNENGQGNRTVSPRPAGNANGQGNRMVSPRPAGNENGQGNRTASPRPAENASGQGNRTVSPRPAGNENGQGNRTVTPRPAATSPQAPTYAEPLEKQARTEVEARELAKETVDTQAHKVRNFMADEDEFEFEFLNWDGVEDK